MNLRKYMHIFLFLFLAIVLTGQNKEIILKTENIDDFVELKSFCMNSKGEIFLYSEKLSRVFKFRPDGVFEKRFLERGEGPGEVMRVLSMFINPTNDCLYFPEFYSMGKGKVTIYDSEGKFKGLFKPAVSLTRMDRIRCILFRKDNTFFLGTDERVDWKPEGQLFITQEKIQIRYFNEKGEFISEIISIRYPGELANAVGWGGPRVLFAPSVIVKLTPDERIAIARNDSNVISIYTTAGKLDSEVKLAIERKKLSDDEFQATKKKLVRLMYKSDERMLELAKKMIKLDYKPFYQNIFLLNNFIVLANITEWDASRTPIKSHLVFFNWKGEKIGEKEIDGIVADMSNNRIVIKTYNDDGDEFYKIKFVTFTF